VGVHPSDARVVDLLRGSGKPFLLVANKVDNAQSSDYFEFYRLNAGDPIPVSAANGINSGDLLDEITNRPADAGRGDPRGTARGGHRPPERRQVVVRQPAPR
jgi:GTP-binding protein